MKDIIFKGCATAIVTPFDDNNNINFDEFKRIVEFQIEQGVNAIVVCGTTGEAATMDENEKEDLIKFCVEVVNKRIPVIAGVGGNNTSKVISTIQKYNNIGVDGYLAVTPYYNKTTQKGLIMHYTEIAKNTKLPIILYNVPSRTGLDISIDTYKELSKIENIVATKEASGDISKILKIKNACKENLNIYSGNDDQILPILSLGGIGVISVLSNVKPKYTVDLMNEFWSGNLEKAINMQSDILPLIEDLFAEVNPIPVKEAMNILGYKCGTPRLPLVECSRNLREKLEKELKQ